MPDDEFDPATPGQPPGNGVQAGKNIHELPPGPGPKAAASAQPASARAGARPRNPRKGPTQGPSAAQPHGQRPAQDGADASKGPHTKTRTPPDLLLDDEELLDHTEAQWEAAGQKQCAEFIEHVGKDYLAILNEFMDYADAATDNYRRMSSVNEKWRKWTIVATGGLATINSIAAFGLIGKITVPEPYNKITLPAMLSAIAAVYAVALTVASNLENFFNAGEKAAGFRESRELFITTYRAYVWRWKVSVEAFGASGKACVNAARLYGRLIRTDRELRVKVKELTETQTARATPRAARP